VIVGEMKIGANKRTCDRLYPIQNQHHLDFWASPFWIKKNGGAVDKTVTCWIGVWFFISNQVCEFH
jgi:hypothetical protein